MIGSPRPRHPRLARTARSLAALALLALVLASPRTVLATPVDRLPSPRPQHWVLDITGTLTAQQVAALDRRAGAAHQRSGGDILVVVIDSTDGREHRAYATELANRWKIGGPEGRNGILLLLATKDRRAEIALSKGIDGAGESITAKAIMDSEMVPRFKTGDPYGGLSAGLDAVADRILTAAADSPFAPAPATPTTDASRAATPFAPLPDSAAPADRPAPPSDSKPARPPRPATRGDFALGCAILLIPVILALVLLRWIWRAFLGPRRCKACKTAMIRLREEQETPYLDPGQEKEQAISSVDYQVWTCLSCQKVELKQKKRFASGYKECPTCHYRTCSSRTETLIMATEFGGGQVRITESCEQCGDVRSNLYSTPRVEPQRTESPARSFFSGRSSRGSSSSSNNSGSGSGGSNFGGGGASGSW